VQVRYAQRLQIFARMSTFGMRITKLICLGVIFLHWNACAQFLVAAAAEFPDGSWVVRMGTAPSPPSFTAAPLFTLLSLSCRTNFISAIPRSREGVPCVLIGDDMIIYLC
jgi:hypothetical protein